MAWHGTVSVASWVNIVNASLPDALGAGKNRFFRRAGAASVFCMEGN